MMERVFLSQLPLMCLSVFRQHLFLQDLNMIILCLMLRLYVRNHFFISQIKHKMNRVEKSQISAVSLLNVKTFILSYSLRSVFFSRSENSTLLRTLFFDMWIFIHFYFHIWFSFIKPLWHFLSFPALLRPCHCENQFHLHFSREKKRITYSRRVPWNVWIKSLYKCDCGDSSAISFNDLSLPPKSLKYDKCGERLVNDRQKSVRGRRSKGDPVGSFIERYCGK